MKYLLAAALLVAFLTPAQADVVSPPDAALILQQSTVRMEVGRDAFCTATKVAPKTFLTARHCTDSLREFDLRFEPEFDVAFPKWVTLPIGTKAPGNRKYDWALIETHTDMEHVAAAQYSCHETPYLGMPVATFGYSSKTQPSFSVGYVASLKPGTRPNQYDFALDIQVAPGASGSAIISLDSGDIVGVLTEGISEQRAGVYLIGAQLVSQTALCD